ncbi:hypothetical protein V2J09_011697 [Rumex salicifolius]
MASDSSSISSTAAATATTTMTSNAAAAAASPASATATATATTTANGVPIVGALPHFVQLRQQRPNIPSSQVQNVPSSSSAPPQTQIQSLPPLRYPLASSGRGFVNSGTVPRPHVQTVAASNPNPNPASYSVPSRSTMGYPPPPRPFGFVPSPPPLVKGFPVSANPHHFKVGPSVCSLPDCVGGHKVSSDNVREDVCVLVRDRRVRIANGASIYALCRSWLKNGHPEESLFKKFAAFNSGISELPYIHRKIPQFADAAKSLPKPAPSSDNCSPKRKKPDEEEENDMDVKAAESLSSEELLKLHIKRAKRVRERLREERLQRIARYKSRLALLLPPLVEQSRNDPSDGGCMMYDI